jgi:pimeloyl-ACP methyl ester carboxylesterase
VSYEVIDVPVPGGTLRTGIWGDSGPIVLAAHGVTGNHVSWQLVAEQLPDVRLVAPDLRGRGGSASLPAPYGMRVHADDLMAVLDHIGAATAVVAGHSMGGFVAASTGAGHPDRVSAVVLVDGGLPLALPPGLDVDQVLAAVLGPAMARLSMTFDDAAAYRAFWRDHPALRDDWNDTIEAYVAYDAMGHPPAIRSSVSIDAVRGDSADQLAPGGSAEDVWKLRCPVSLLWAAKGLQGEPPGLYDETAVAGATDRLPQLQASLVPGVNHYTITLAPHGAAAVATAIRAAL